MMSPSDEVLLKTMELGGVQFHNFGSNGIPPMQYHRNSCDGLKYPPPQGQYQAVIKLPLA